MLWSTGSRHVGPVVVANGLSGPVACGIFLDQGSNQCALHGQANSYPLDHPGSPLWFLYILLLEDRTAQVLAVQ